MDKALKFIGSTSEDKHHHVLSKNALQIILDAVDDIDDIYDMHTHLGGSEKDITGCCTHPNLDSMFHIFSYAQQMVFKSSAGITSKKGGDQEYLNKLIERTENFSYCVNSKGNLPKYRHLLLALAKWYDPDGTERMDKTSMYIPNEYMMKVVENRPDLFDACVSINPYQSNALKELKFYAKQGVRVLKWLPNSMGIKMDDPSIIPFYNKMCKYSIILLCHVGDEHAMSAGGTVDLFAYICMLCPFVYYINLFCKNMQHNIRNNLYNIHS